VSTPAAIRVVLADDQQLVRSGFRMILRADDRVEVVGEAGDGVEAVSLARELRPDVVLMDVRMPRVDGIEATRQICAATECPRVLVLTTFDLDEYVFAALRAGASGFLLKDAPEEHLLAALNLDALTAREVEVLRLLARGRSNAEIAAELVVSEHTVKTHVARVLGKLDLRDRIQAVILAYECGLTRPGSP